VSQGVISVGLFSGDDGIVIGAAAKKRLVYLDSNIWIDLAERDLAVAEQCRMAVRTGKVLFPVSTPAVTEVFDQPDTVQRSHVAALMDELCGGVSFRPTSFIHALEAELALTVLLGGDVTGISRDKILCWIAECFAKMNINIPPSWDQTKAEKFIREFPQQPELRSVRWFADQYPADQMLARKKEQDNRYVERMTASIKEGAMRVQPMAKDQRWRQLLLEERMWAVNKFVRPSIASYPTKVAGSEDAMAEVVRRVEEGSEERFNRPMAVMPSLDLFCHIMAERRRDPARKVYRQDFHDVEHAIVGGAYADFFVTSDGHLFDLLTQRCSIPAARGCRIVRGVKGLEEILKSRD